MNQALLKYHLEKSGLFSKAEINSLVIKDMPGSTHAIYRVDANDSSYVIKIPKRQAYELVDRNNEYHASRITAEAGINIPFLYYDFDSGVNITTYLETVTIVSPMQDSAILSKVVAIFKKLHQLPKRFSNDINIFSVIDFYKNKISDKTPDGFEALLEWHPHIQKYQRELQIVKIETCPCHNDPIPSNFILNNQGRLFLIDWEYAGNNDPLWDLAVFTTEADFNLHQEHAFLNEYFQGKITSSEDARYLIYKIISDYLWVLWSIAMSDINNATKHFKKLEKTIFPL
jgi:thiamine kinase-like enzyme